MTTLDEADTNQADKMPPAEEIKAAAESLVDLIKLRTFPFGVRTKCFAPTALLLLLSRNTIIKKRSV